jgi:hypothetical protein
MMKMFSKKYAGGKTAFSTLMYVTVILTTWFLANFLLVFGILFMLFLMFANASFLGFFTEINNLADRYLSAGSEAQRSFQGDVKRVLFILTTLVCYVRFPHLVRTLIPDLNLFREIAVYVFKK